MSRGFDINDTKFDIFNTRSKRITAKAIKEMDADVICLQEVENLPVLDRFNSEFLGGPKHKRYTHRILVDGNDPRRIDVALISRRPIGAVRTYRHERNEANTAAKFSRDCLRAEIEVDGGTLTLYGNHFKSMMGGRKKTRARRLEQSERVSAILREDWGDNLDGDFLVLGDLNDYPQKGGGTTTSLGSLLNEPELVNIVDRLPKNDRWTHYWAGGREYRQLDYLLLSKSLDDASGKPVPMRVLDGLPWRADRYEGDRFEDVGDDSPKASDHVPLFVDVKVGKTMI
ncbi:endonuclease/exonuclease/phosphatase family protein [Tropicibacter sp. Alg240-R139]|uniref:endonuclease/exonuclease/phosphatase family protein n=1 Tax=Tropicibacter sp. Alg240-R139 TaxID=2305991 RepID=UPI0019670C0E|nr:endonuclease/exonuclease/phosphatase family protein [Tropicibacter sp. Alg240-R139]